MCARASSRAPVAGRAGPPFSGPASSVAMHSWWVTLLTRTVGAPRLGRPGRVESFGLLKGDAQALAQAFELAGDRIAGHPLPGGDLLFGQVFDEFQAGHLELVDTAGHDRQALVVGGGLLRRRLVGGHLVAQDVLRVLVGLSEIGPATAVTGAVTREVHHRVDEDAARPRLEPAHVLQVVEPLTREELQEGALHRVLEVVLQPGVAPAGDGEPLTAERLQDFFEPRVRRTRLRRAQDGEDRLG